MWEKAVSEKNTLLLEKVGGTDITTLIPVNCSGLGALQVDYPQCKVYRFVFRILRDFLGFSRILRFLG